MTPLHSLQWRLLFDLTPTLRGSQLLAKLASQQLAHSNAASKL
jgi:hypothetical protein